MELKARSVKSLKYCFKLKTLIMSEMWNIFMGSFHLNYFISISEREVGRENPGGKGWGS